MIGRTSAKANRSVSRQFYFGLSELHFSSRTFISRALERILYVTGKSEIPLKLLTSVLVPLLCRGCMRAVSRLVLFKLRIFFLNFTYGFPTGLFTSSLISNR